MNVHILFKPVHLEVSAVGCNKLGLSCFEHQITTKKKKPQKKTKKKADHIRMKLLQIKTGCGDKHSSLLFHPMVMENYPSMLIIFP